MKRRKQRIDTKTDKRATPQPLMMKTVRSSERTGIMNSTTQHKSPEVLNPQQNFFFGACASLNLISSIGEKGLFS
jgi:hypothetical protein